MADTVEHGAAGEATKPVKKRGKVGKVFKISGLLLLLIIVLTIIINSLLVMFKDDYYTTFGKYRLFAVVTGSMEDTIPKGSMIVATKPTSPSEISAGTSGKKDGTVVTFKYHEDGENYLLTHRVVSIEVKDGETRYYTRGDNAEGNDKGYRTYKDIVGIYTGKKCGFFGSLFGFFQSGLGVSVLIFTTFVIVIAWIVLSYINKNERQKELETAALKKSAEALSSVNLRYDNIHEITAVMDVLGMVTENPQSRSETNAIADRLNAFVRAENIELPQTPETAAILDSLPAPDTPGALAAALAAGATLRQAEDGETLVLTTMSGGKNILLTPVQTADGVILCQQGARIKSDLAPNIEEIGMTSMPASPEFFEGQPLEKNVVYPELPQPDRKFGPEMLSPHSPAAAQGADIAAIAASPKPAAGALAAGGSASAEELKLLESSSIKKSVEMRSEPKPAAPAITDPVLDIINEEPQAEDALLKSKLAYARYREQAAAMEIKQAEKLQLLLVDATPLSYDEQLKVAEFKATVPPKKKRKPKTPEQRAKAKVAAQERARKREEFLAQLSDEDRELYLTEQKLIKSRESTIRRLRKIVADRKILDSLNSEE